MIALGKKQELTVAKVVDFGVYLGEKETAGEKDTDVYKRQEVTLPAVLRRQWDVLPRSFW